MPGFVQLIAGLMGYAIFFVFIALVLVVVRAVWRFFLRVLAPDPSPPLEVASAARDIPPEVSSSRASALTPDRLEFAPASAFSVEPEDFEIRVSVSLNHGIGRRLTIEVRGGPLPSPAESLVYVITALSYEQGKECPLRVRPTDSLSSQPFSSVHARPSVARLREAWTVLTFIDLDAVYPARSGRQSYVFTCRVHRPGPDISVGLPGPHGRAIDTANATAYLDLADFGYLEMHEWVKVREDAVTFLVRVVHQCEVSLGTKWARLSDWVLALRPASAPQVVQDYAKKSLANYYRALRAAPSTSSNQSIALGKDASPDFQRELVALARGLVNEEPADSPARKTYESLRGTCWEALSTWVERDKEPLPPRPVSQPAKPTPSAPTAPVLPPPTPSPAPAWAPLPQPWEPDPVPVPLGGGDQEKVEQLRAVLAMARVAAVLGFSNTTHAQDKILDKFKRRLIDNVRDDATRARVEADLQAYLDEATAVIGQLSYFKRRLDAAVAPVGFYIRDLLGETMRELILARSDCSADGFALYGYCVRKYAWAPLSVPRPKRFPAPAPKPRPVPAPKPRPVPAPKPRPAPAPKPTPAPKPRPAPPPKPAPVRPANPTPPPPKMMSTGELMRLLAMPAGLDRAGQLVFIKGEFGRLNNRMGKERKSYRRAEISYLLLCLGELGSRLE